MAPVFLGEDARDFALTRLVRAEDAFAQLMSEREAAALRPAEARVVALSARRSRDRRAGGAGGMVLDLPPPAGGGGLEGAWRLDREPRPRHDARHARALRVRQGSSAEERRRAEENRKRQRARVEEIVGDDGVLMLPTVPAVAPKRDLSGDALQAYRERALSILCIAGLSGLPQVTMPLARLDCPPLGLSLIGPRGADRALVALALRIAAGA